MNNVYLSYNNMSYIRTQVHVHRQGLREFYEKNTNVILFRYI